MAWSPGESIGHYKLGARCGEGGIGVVWSGRDQKSGRKVALKLLRIQDEVMGRRMVREAKLQGGVSSPNIVEIIDLLDHEGQPIIVMEYVSGPSLHAWMNQGPPPTEELDRVALGLMDGLAAAHGKGLVHRDLKPENVLMEPGDEGLVPKISDFGLVLSLDNEDEGPRLTPTNVMMGTPGYMAPEQALGAARVDHRADLFSMGAILFELCVGKRAFPGMNYLNVLKAAAAGDYLDPAVLCPNLPVRMVSAIHAALHPSLDHRVGDIETLRGIWDGSERWTPRVAVETHALAPEPPPSEPGHVLQLEVCSINLRTRRYTGDKGEGVLTDTDVKLLAYLAENPHRDIPREELLENVWGYVATASSRTTDTAVRRLRKKLERDPTQPRHILTVRHVGYRFEPLEKTQPVPLEKLTPTTMVPEDLRVAPAPAPPQLRTNLGRERNTFVGRVDDLKLLATCRAQGQRMLTLLGPPGTGKTRLAQRFGAQSLADGVVDSAWFCDLSEATTGSAILQAVALVLQVPLTGKDGESALAETLGHALQGHGRTLLILDNAEQVAEPLGQLLDSWWQQTETALFLVTSRVPLNLEMEQRIPVEPLPLPEGTDEDLGENPAVALFLSRARKFKPAFLLNADNEEDIVAIVSDVDGLPLAIELAAARVRMWSLQRIRARLSDRFRLLSLPSNPGLRRQASLRAAIEWSWELLTPWEQAALAQCSVFRGGFDWDAVDAVVDLSEWPDAPWPEDVVDRLVAHSLVRLWDVDGDNRLGMLVSIGEFAAEKLTGDAEVAAQKRHAAYYGEYGAEEYQRSLHQHGGLGRRRKLHGELENLLVASKRSAEHGWVSDAVGASLACVAVWSLLGPYQDGIQLVDRVLDLDVSSVARARLLWGKFELLLALGSEDAEACCQQVLGLYQEQSNRRMEGRALRGLALLFRDQGKTEEGVEYFEEAMKIADEHNDRLGLANGLGGIGNLYYHQSRMDEALAHYERALGIYQEMGNRQQEGLMVGNIGNVYSRTGRLEEALDHYLRALSIHREVRHRRNEGLVLGSIGLLYRERGRMDEASAHYELALSIHREVGHRMGEALQLGNMGIVYRNQGRVEEALQSYTRALSIFREVKKREYQGNMLCNIGILHGSQGRMEEAMAHYKEALAIQRETGSRLVEGITLGNMGELLLKQGNLEAAAEHYAEAISIGDTISPLVAGTFRGSLGLVRGRQGAFDQARDLLSRGDEQLREVYPEDHGKLLCKRGQVECLADNIAAAQQALEAVEAIASEINANPKSDLGRSIADLRDRLAPSGS